MLQHAVYFGGLSELFFNSMIERTLLEDIAGSLCVFLFPLAIYFCIFTFMVRPASLFLSEPDIAVLH